MGFEGGYFDREDTVVHVVCADMPAGFVISVECHWYRIWHLAQSEMPRFIFAEAMSYLIHPGAIVIISLEVGNAQMPSCSTNIDPFFWTRRRRGLVTA